MSVTTANWERPTLSGTASSDATTRRVEVKGTSARKNYTFASEEEAIRARDELQTEIFGQLEQILAVS